ncbi:MAG: transglycosylase domain-containing protein [Desulfobulbales bacterium]
MIKKIIYTISAFIALSIGAGLVAFFWLVVLFPGDSISQSNIEKILSMESPVYYSDGQNKIGVFFKEAHRQYIQYEEIPKDFVNAIIASEDNNFFNHFGVDIPGIMRALLANIRAGKIVQGGSTITQQTAKNLFKRKDRSLKAKLTELLNALRLEYHYPKEKIMEFYANQFYVSGNGHGLGVAAQYYFNKNVSELNTLECAFIAGSVKSPNSYNPFIKDNEEKAELAVKRAKKRAGYVLGQMLKLNMITSAQYEEYMHQDIAFEQGKMFFPLNTLMDFVKAGLSVPEVEEALSANGIDNIATSGIRIFTTVEQDLQDGAFYDLRKELSRLSVRLKGYEHNTVQQYYNSMNHAGDQELHEGAFLFGTVTSVDMSDKPVITVFLGKLVGKQNLTGIIDRSGIMPVIDSLVKWERERWTEPSEDDLQKFLEGFKAGDKIFVSVRKIDRNNNTILLDLEKYPEIQGSIIALKDGTIRAMVGGMENHFFNRAVDAKRPMGSVIKPLVYTAAIQLGWNSIDALDNERNLFVYQKQAYFPRPDHNSPYKLVSMNWAGVHSENVATVWLLYHLCDHLTPAQFKELISHLDLDRREYESSAGYRQRLRDSLGILVDQEQLYRAAFREAVINFEPDLIFSGKLTEYQYLKKMQYGADFESFLEEVDNLEGPSYESESKRQTQIEAEKSIRQKILKNNYLHHVKLMHELKFLRASLEGELNTSTLETPEMFLGHFYHDTLNDKFIYASEPNPNGTWEILSPADIQKELHPFSFAWFKKNFQNNFWADILLEGNISLSTFETLKDAVEDEFRRLSALPPYSFEVLSLIPDFRVLAGLRYMTALGKALNIRSELEPVLSFPLGSNVISPLEAAMTYQALTTGYITVSGSDDSVEALSIIDHIENSEGETIYAPQREKNRVVDARTSLAVSNILRNVIKFGTGRYAFYNVRLQSRNPEVEKQLKQLDLPLPLMGKTGTANRFTNSAFAGVVPGPVQGKNGFSVNNGYTVVSYVGYDDNVPMVRSTTHITGAGGALPVWTRMANTILVEKEFEAKLDLVDLAFSVDPLTGETGLRLIMPDLEQKIIPVDAANGLPGQGLYDNKRSSSSLAATILTFGTLLPNGELDPDRSFQPFWRN